MMTNSIRTMSIIMAATMITNTTTMKPRGSQNMTIPVTIIPATTMVPAGLCP